MTAFATTAPVGSVTTPCRLEVTTWACAAPTTHTTASKNRLPLRWFMRGSLAPPFSQRRNSVLRLTSDLPRIFFFGLPGRGHCTPPCLQPRWDADASRCKKNYPAEDGGLLKIWNT